MRRIMRHVVFALCFTLGSTAWYILAQRISTPVQPAQAAEEKESNQNIAQSDSEQPEVVPAPSIKSAPPEPLTGYANAKTVILRESPDANAPIVAKLKAGEYEQVTILGATGNFVRVRFVAYGDAVDGVSQREKDYEGWTTWASVYMDISAIVLDAETGAVVSRVPLSEGLSSVTFSQDGSRGLFFHNSDGIGRAAYEFRTSDYTITRSLTSSDGEYLGTLFYGADSGELYAAVQMSDETSTESAKVSLVRIGEGDAASVASELNLSKSNFAISRDGLTGFMTRPQNGNPNELTVDVIDLAARKVRNTFTLTGENFPSDSSNFTLSRDGSELYIRLSDISGAISVIDTRTGQFIRQLPDSATGEWSYFGRDSLVGDSLLLRVWEGGEDDSRSQLYWVGASGRVAAESGIDFAVEAGGKRYAINENGTLLFKLDAYNRIQQRIKIARPELQKGMPDNGLSVFGVSASPDGKRIIIIIGMEHGC